MLSQASTPSELVSGLRARGVKIHLESGKVRLSVPKGALAGADVDELRRAESELVEYLTDERAIVSLPLASRGDTGIDVPLTGTQAMPWLRTHVKRRSRLGSMCFRVIGQLDAQLLSKSICALTSRHEALRTRIVSVNGVVRQRMATEVPAPACIDVSNLAYSSAEAAAKDHALSMIHREIDLATDPLFDACIVTLRPDEIILAISIDHVIMDAWSIGILQQELWLIYDALANGRDPVLPALPVQFADFAVWQSAIRPLWERMHGRYWKERLLGAPRLTCLENRELGNSRQRFSTEEVSVDRELMRKLLDVARERRVLLPLIVLSAYLGALSILCSQRDLTVAFVDSGRYRPELFPVVGCVACLLNLIVRRAANAALSDLLASVKEEWLSVSERRDFDWGAALAPGFESEIMFNWMRSQRDVPQEISSESAAQDISNRTIEPVELSQNLELPPDVRFPCKICFLCFPVKGTTKGLIWYDSCYFRPTEMRRLADHVVLFLAKYVEQPEAKIESEELRMPIN